MASDVNSGIMDNDSITEELFEAPSKRRAQNQSLPPKQGTDNSGVVITGLFDKRKQNTQKTVTFDRRELQTILNLYGRRVAEGEWRDYAISFSSEKAIFAIFHRTAERALYTIEKKPALSRKQGAFAIISNAGLILRRGHDLARVLEILDKKLKIIK